MLTDFLPSHFKEQHSGKCANTYCLMALQKSMKEKPMTQNKWTKMKQELKKRSKKESRENEDKIGLAHNFINLNLSVRFKGFGLLRRSKK